MKLHRWRHGKHESRQPLRLRLCHPAQTSHCLPAFPFGTLCGGFDPKADTIVRAQARRLRAKLAEYYEKNGYTSGVAIELPKGAYVPVLAYPHTFPDQPQPLVSPPSRRRISRMRALFAAGVAVLGLLAGMALLRWR